MSKELLIGRSPLSVIPVPSDKVSVSGAHVKIIVKDNGDWELEDLNSGNGTFVRDHNGNFQRVYKKHIEEKTIIRLGKEGHDSFVFMAHRALASDASYAYEFNCLKKLLRQQLEDEDAVERKNSRNMNIVKASSPIAMALCILLQYIVPGLQDNSTINLWISRAAMGVAPLAVGLFFGIDRNAVKLLKQKRLKVLTCPKCGRPISEYDIQNMQCSHCKAK